MPLFEWSAEYELAIQQIDDQHKELVKMINDLYRSIREGHSSETVNLTLNRLLQYVEVHFSTEEAAMRKWEYPDYEEHHLRHEELREKVLDLKKQQLEGQQVATFELLNFLVGWLKNHIGHTDVAFGKYVSELERRNTARS